METGELDQPTENNIAVGGSEVKEIKAGSSKWELRMFSLEERVHIKIHDAVGMK